MYMLRHPSRHFYSKPLLIIAFEFQRSSANYGRKALPSSNLLILLVSYSESMMISKFVNIVCTK